MHDLSTINKLNTERFLEDVEQARALGHTVVVEKAGLTAVGFKAFKDVAAANAHAAAYTETSPDAAAQILPPTGV